MPAINSNTPLPRPIEGAQNYEEESLRLLKRVKEQYPLNFKEALDTACQITFTPFRTQAFYHIFPQFLIHQPEQAIQSLNFIDEPTLKEECQVFACYKLHKIGRDELVKKVAESLSPFKLKQMPFIKS